MNPLGEINIQTVDRFTIGHAAFGMMLGLVRTPWYFMIPIAVGWELLERPLKQNIPGLFPHAVQDTVPNAAFDALAMLAGWGSMMLIPPTEGQRRYWAR